MADTFKLQKAYEAYKIPLPDYQLSNSLEATAARQKLAESGTRHGNHRKMLAKEKVRTRRDTRINTKIATKQELRLLLSTRSPMGRSIIKLNAGDRDYYLEFSSIVDAPVTFGMSLEEFTDYYRIKYGTDSVELDFPDRKRVEEKGTSSHVDVFTPTNEWNSALDYLGN